jgi:peroxiredoxin
VRSDDVTLSVGDAAPDVVLGLSDAEHVRLSQYWVERPLVVAFLRHFG